MMIYENEAAEAAFNRQYPNCPAFHANPAHVQKLWMDSWQASKAHSIETCKEMSKDFEEKRMHGCSVGAKECAKALKGGA